MTAETLARMVRDVVTCEGGDTVTIYDSKTLGRRPTLRKAKVLATYFDKQGNRHLDYRWTDGNKRHHHVVDRDTVSTVLALTERNAL